MKIEFLPAADILIRVAAAILAGALIGFEREITHHPAGLKTHILVCLGAALSGLTTAEMARSVVQDTTLMSAVSEAMGRVNLDISRIAAGVVTGIGFIGAGAIMKSRDGTIVTGITTAATLWVTACIGLSIGMGYMVMSVSAVMAVFTSNIVIKNVENKLLSKVKERTVDLIVINKNQTIKAIEEYCAPRRIKIRNFEYTGVIKDFADGVDSHRLRYTLKTPNGMSFLLVLKDLAMQDNILQVKEADLSKKRRQKVADDDIMEFEKDEHEEDRT